MAVTHLIVGAGNMGGALLSGWLRDSQVSPRNLAIIDPSPGTDAVFAIERGAKHLAGPSAIPRSVETILLAVKPQIFAAVARDIADALEPGALLISIMAGIGLDRLRETFPDCRVVRAMPNTPASIGQGITAYVGGEDIDDTLRSRTEALLLASGHVLRVDEDADIDAVTAISGSGPAYLFHLVEALESSARSLGLNDGQAALLARHTVLGASGLLDASERDPQDLREAVTSPGGTTQAALDVLMGPGGLTELMRRATRAAWERSRELSR